MTFGKVLDNKIRLVLVTLPVAVINKYSDNNSLRKQVIILTNNWIINHGREVKCQELGAGHSASAVRKERERKMLR